MHVEVRAGTAQDSLAIENLHDWLSADDDLRSHLQLLRRPPAAGELGSAVDALVAAVAPGGVAVALIGGIVAWLRSRHGDLILKIRRSDGAEAELTAPLVRRISPQELPAVLSQLASWIVILGQLPAQLINEDSAAGSMLENPKGQLDA